MIVNWDDLAPGAEVELGFLKIDRVGSTQDHDDLAPKDVYAKRTEYRRHVEAVARAYDVALPIGFAGDGAMIFVRGDRGGFARSGAPAPSAAVVADMANAMLTQMRAANFDVRIAAHVGRVVVGDDPGALSGKDVDLCGHLESAAPTNTAVLSADVYEALPSAARERYRFVGVTARDRTACFATPPSRAAAAKPEKFDSAATAEFLVRLRYLRTFERPELARVRYVGFALARPDPPSLDLFDVFAPLRVSAARTAFEWSPDFDAESFDAALRDGGSAEGLRVSPGLPWIGRRTTATDAAPPEPYADVFRRNRCGVLLGDPGAGKSTLLRWTALVLARGRASTREILGVDVSLTPFLVTAAGLDAAYVAAAKDGVAPDSFEVLASAVSDALGPAPALESPSDVVALVRREFDASRAVLLIDGLDEAPPDRLDVVRAWIEGFAARAEGHRIWATSRVVGYSGLTLPGGFVATVQPFDAEARAGYLRAWYRAYRSWESGLSAEAAERDARVADAEAAALSARLEADPRLATLAANPLLLSAIALVNRAVGALPNRRAQLYDVLARTFCQEWGRARRVVVGAQPTEAPSRIDYATEALPKLGRVAYEMHRRGLVAAPRADVVEWLAAGALEAGEPKNSAVAAADALLNRALRDVQILVERGPGRVGFMHLTLQEHFAASWLLSEDRFEDEAAKRWWDVRWREVVLLGFGAMAHVQGRTKRVGQLLTELLECKDGGRWLPPQHAEWLVTLLHVNVRTVARVVAETDCRDEGLESRLAERVAKELHATESETLLGLWGELVRGIEGSPLRERVLERFSALHATTPKWRGFAMSKAIASAGFVEMEGEIWARFAAAVPAEPHEDDARAQPLACLAEMRGGRDVARFIAALSAVSSDVLVRLRAPLNLVAGRRRNSAVELWRARTLANLAVRPAESAGVLLDLTAEEVAENAASLWEIIETDEAESTGMLLLGFLAAARLYSVFGVDIETRLVEIAHGVRAEPAAYAASALAQSGAVRLAPLFTDILLSSEASRVVAAGGRAIAALERMGGRALIDAAEAVLRTPLQRLAWPPLFLVWRILLRALARSGNPGALRIADAWADRLGEVDDVAVTLLEMIRACCDESSTPDEVAEALDGIRPAHFADGPFLLELLLRHGGASGQERAAHRARAAIGPAREKMLALLVEYRGTPRSAP